MFRFSPRFSFKFSRRLHHFYSFFVILLFKNEHNSDYFRQKHQCTKSELFCTKLKFLIKTLKKFSTFTISVRFFFVKFYKNLIIIINKINLIIIFIIIIIIINLIITMFRETIFYKHLKYVRHMYLRTA